MTIDSRLRSTLIVGVFALTACPVAAAHAESPADSLKRDFPGWKYAEAPVVGDLNGDKLPDFAAILYKPIPGKTAPEESKIVVYLGEKSGAFKLHTAASKATCIGCGGMKSSPSDPLGSLAIDPGRGVLVITYEGGSREVWTQTFKWRWDRKIDQLVLIGETDVSEDTMDEEPREIIDINFGTLRAERSVGATTKICGVGAKFKGQSLQGFDYENRPPSDKLLEKCKPGKSELKFN